ncbi:MAG: hypothetical protein R2818_02680 [Flavobacteriales bacterium]
MSIRAALFVLSFTTVLFSSAQDRSPWADVPLERVAGVSGERRITPKARILQLDVAAMRDQLAQVPLGSIMGLAEAVHTIELPTADGSKAHFRILEVPVVHPELQARFPETHFVQRCRDRTDSHSEIGPDPHGFHAMVLPGDRDAWFIDPRSCSATTVTIRSISSGIS